MRAVGRSGIQTVLAVLLVLMAGALERANAQTSAQISAAQGGPTTEQLFDQAIEKADEFDAIGWPPRGRFTPFPKFTQAYVEFNRRLWNKHGITYLFAPTLMMQKGTQGGSQDFTASEQYQGLVAWRALNKTRIGTGYFIANNLHTSQLDKTSGVDFSQSLGINYFTSDTPGNTETVKALLWRHEFPGDFLTLLVGHDEMSAINGGCRYACDDTQSFFSTPLSANPASTLPGQGAAVSADLNLTESVIIEAGIADARGDGNINFKRVFRHDERVYIAALKLQNPFKSIGDGHYKATYYKVDATRPGTSSAKGATEGFAAQLDQDFGDLGVFAKYHQAFRRKGSIEKTASAGVVLLKPFGNDEDRLGVGLGWVDPTAPGTNDEYVAETYYRMQLTPFVQLTAGAMLVMNPSAPGSDTEGVFSLRMRGHY